MSDEIRRATFDDGPAIMATLRELFATAPTTGSFYSIDETDAAETIAAIMESDHGIPLVAFDEQGLAALVIAVVAPLPFNRSFPVANTVVFWVRPTARGKGLAGRLADALERLAAEAGAKALLLGFSRGCSESAMGRLCKRRGMAPKESLYIKRLGA